VRNYLSELRYVFVYYSETDPKDFTEEMMLRYLVYLAKTLGCSRVKCRMAAQSISFFFRHVLKIPYVVPSIIYPRVSSKLPPVMSAEEIKKLIESIKNVKHRTVVMLLYSTGMRLSEIAALKITDIDSKNMCIKVVQGKGAKDRFTILSQSVLQELRAYYLICKPAVYLFNGSSKGRPISHRSIQHLVQKSLVQAGLNDKNYTVHTIRHSFATHLIDNGTDLHTVKELLGHSNLQTTLRYLHFTSGRMQGVVNPYDMLDEVKGNEQPAVTHPFKNK
jgi:integrase/recombinase XerD